jgi:RNA polymerase sigma factor (sigma-70 family)
VSGRGGPEGTSTDAELISKSLVDPECFTLIVKRHATPVFRYLASRVDRSAAEDLLADVFDTAFRARQRYDPAYDDALAWLIGIATNVLRHHHRSEARRTSMMRRMTQLLVRHHEQAEATDPVSTTAELHDQMGNVRRALAALDDKHREVLVLSAGLGLSYEHIALSLGVRIGTVRSRLSRARVRLRELLEADGQYRTYSESDRGRVEEERPQ